MAEPDSHLTAEQLLDHVQERVPRANPSTVYRTLDLLVDEGLVLRTDLGGGRAFYEPAREHPHHHVVCRGCGAVVHVHEDALGDLRQRLERASGYALGAEEITFSGLCPTCRATRSARG